MNATEFLWAIGRATAFTTASSLVALALVTLLRVRSPRLHCAAWFLAVMPGWLLVPWTWRVETPPVVTPEVSLRAEVQTEITVSPAASAIPTPVADSQATANPARPLLVTYAGGMIVLLGVGFARYLRFVKRLPQSEAPLEPDWQHEWQRQLRAIRARRPIELRVTADLGPLLCFVPFRYLVLVPRPLWTALARPQRTAILRHELAHWRRGDLWWSLTIRALAMPQWFNPLAWLAIRRFDEAGEWACDDLVARGRRSHQLSFARSLLAAADFATTNTPGTAAIQGGQLARRVRRLVSQRFKEETQMKKFLVIVPLAAIVVAQAIRIERVTADERAPTSSRPISKSEAEAQTTSPPQGDFPPAYVIEPPDVLLITPIRLTPKPPRRIRRFEPLSVQVIGLPADQKIAEGFEVDADGRINLGPPYGRIRVEGLTVDEAETALEKKLKEYFDAPDVGLSLVWASDHQILAGKYLVGPDGRINLGAYGTLYVSGMPIDVARCAIEERLAESLDNPKIALDVDQYNSKKYYVITRNSNKGDNVVAAAITGNDTVLDALAIVDDALKQESTRIWISRPSDNGAGDSKILPVNWNEIVDGTSTATNYQLLAGDRLFVVNNDQTANASTETEPIEIPQPKFLRSPHANMELRSDAKADAASTDQAEFAIDILEDQNRALAEFDALRGKAPFVAVDSATIGPMLRTLASHGLIRKLSVPKIYCDLGDAATMSSDSLEERGGPKIHLRLTANRTDRGEIVKLQLATEHEEEGRKLELAVNVKPGQTVLIPVRYGADTPESAGSPNPICLAITPSFPKPPATAEGLNSYYYHPSEPPTGE